MKLPFLQVPYPHFVSLCPRVFTSLSLSLKQSISCESKAAYCELPCWIWRHLSKAPLHFTENKPPPSSLSGKNKIKGLMCHTSDKICAGHKCFISRAALVTQRHRVPRPWPLPSTCHKSRGGAEKTNNALRQGVFFTPPISSRIYEASKAQLETCFQK